jgi:adenine phosphoribosyltransferase
LNKLSKDDRDFLLDSIRDVENFPKDGIVFKDITTLLSDKKPFQILMNHLESRYMNMGLEYIVGLDARGFIFGSILADRLKIGFVPIRKKGKLPSKTINKKYDLEYGSSEVEIHKDAFNNQNSKVLIIDDLCATGGTASASAQLIDEIGGNLVEVCFIINLTFLEGSKKVEKLAPVYSVLEI